MGSTWALLPIKAPARAKSRLADALDQGERTELADRLRRDVIAALQAATGIDAIAILGSASTAQELARSSGARWLDDDPALGLSGNIDAGMSILAREGAGTVIVVPADLPLLAPADVEALLEAHGDGLSVVPATSDGGTNALAMTPPGIIACCFGKDSARLHLERARQHGIAARLLQPATAAGGFLAGFARDLDTVDDVRWLCRQPGAGHARRYLEESGICARLRADD